MHGEAYDGPDPFSFFFSVRAESGQGVFWFFSSSPST